MGQEPRGVAAMPPSHRRMYGQIGALTRWARVNDADERRSALDAANAALRGRWEREADPDGVLPPEELALAVARLKTIHFRRPVSPVRRRWRRC